LHDTTHQFYCIQYRRLDIPPPNGEDFDMLERFHDSDSSESFYLHYPWLLNKYAFNRLIAGTVDEEHHRSRFELASRDLGSDEAELFQDQYVRSCACDDWNHQSFRNELLELVSLQVLRAKAARFFLATWERLRSGVPKCSASVPFNHRETKRQLLQNHIQQEEISKITALYSAYCGQREEEWMLHLSGLKTQGFSTRCGFFEVIALRPPVSRSISYVHTLRCPAAVRGSATTSRRCGISAPISEADS
jgi:hypothetical protein